MKPLKQEEYHLEIVKDLGREFPTSTSKEKVRYAIFKCTCGNEFKASTKDVRRGSIVGCKKCRSLRLAKKVSKYRTAIENVELGKKICYACKEDKPLSEFSKSKNSNDGVGSRCKVCDNKARKKYYASNQKGRELAYIKSRARYLKATYNMTLAEYDAILVKQNNSCAICNKPLSQQLEEDGAKCGLDCRPRMFAVDHCHATGKNRGLLCNECNRALGFFKDNPEILRTAAQYIDDWAKQHEE